jgi:hypothetical protein
MNFLAILNNGTAQSPCVESTISASSVVVGNRQSQWPAKQPLIAVPSLAWLVQFFSGNAGSAGKSGLRGTSTGRVSAATTCQGLVDTGKLRSTRAVVSGGSALKMKRVKRDGARQGEPVER